MLSLDGGGMRGTYTATYLDRVAATFAGKRRGVAALDIGAAFDLIVGTSTGGIIACALAAGIPLGEIVELYALHGPAIFSRSLPTGAGGVFWDHRKRPQALASGTAELRSALTEKLGAENARPDGYAERGIALAIPAVEMSQHRGWVFKTPHLPGTNHRDDNYSLVDVCLATSAAPIYRSLAAVDHPDPESDGFNVFVDGGLWANNPVLVGLTDALDLTEKRTRNPYLLSWNVPAAGRRASPERRGESAACSGWKFGGEASPGLSIDAQQFTFDHMAKKLARHVDRSCVHRYSLSGGDKVPAALIPYLGLDETRREAIDALINQARTDADMTNSKCGYVDTDPEAALICALFRSAPPLTKTAGFPKVARGIERRRSLATEKG